MKCQTFDFVQSSSFRRFIISSAVAVGATLALTGCAGTLLVSHDFSVSARGIDPSGRRWNADPTKIETTAASSIGLGSAVVRIRAQQLEWTFQTANHRIGIAVVNLSDSELAIEFEKAQVSSNFHPRSVALSDLISDALVLHELTTQDRTPLTESSHLKLSAVKLPPRASVRLSLIPKWQLLFPNTTLFNAVWQGDGKVIESGRGNWLTLTVPVEQKAGRETFEFTLVSEKIATRIVNF